MTTAQVGKGGGGSFLGDIGHLQVFFGGSLSKLTISLEGISKFSVFFGVL